MKAKNWLMFMSMAVFWGLNWSITKTGLSFVSPTTFVLQRFLFFSISFFPVLFLLRARIPRDRDTVLKIVILCMINVSQIVTTNIALSEQSSGMGAVLNYTEPLFVFCLAIPFLEEEISVLKVTGVLVGFGGVFVLFYRSMSSFTFVSAAIMVLSAFMWAVTIVFYKKFLSHVNSFVASYFQYSLGAIPISVFALLSSTFAMPSDPTYLWILVYESIAVSAVGSTVWLYLTKKEGATVVAGSSLLVPVLALFFGWLLLNEEIRIESVIGSALILTGVFLVNLATSKKKSTV